MRLPRLNTDRCARHGCGDCKMRVTRSVTILVATRRQEDLEVVDGAVAVAEEMLLIVVD